MHDEIAAAYNGNYADHEKYPEWNSLNITGVGFLALFLTISVRPTFRTVSLLQNKQANIRRYPTLYPVEHLKEVYRKDATMAHPIHIKILIRHTSLFSSLYHSCCNVLIEQNKEAPINRRLLENSPAPLLRRRKIRHALRHFLDNPRKISYPIYWPVMGCHPVINTTYTYKEATSHGE